MIKQLYYNLDLNLFSFIKHKNINIFFFTKQGNKFVLYLKIQSVSFNQFIIKKIVLKNF